MAYIWVGENENENVEEGTIKKWLNSCVLCTNYMILNSAIARNKDIKQLFLFPESTLNCFQITYCYHDQTTSNNESKLKLALLD